MLLIFAEAMAEAHRTREGARRQLRPVIWFTTTPIADMPGKALDPRRTRRVMNVVLDAVLAVGRG